MAGDKGKPGRPKKADAARNAITAKLSDDELAALEALIATKNARAEELGLGGLTVSTFVRRLVQDAIARGDVPAHRPESLPAPPAVIANGHTHDASEPDVGASGSDERQVRPPMHKRRVRSVAEGTEGAEKPSVGAGEDTPAAGAPANPQSPREPEPDDVTPGVSQADLDRMLEGTNL